MSLLPTTTLTGNELKLHDFKGTKMSLTFGDTDINDGYSYLRANIRANDTKCDFWQDKPIFNFIADEEITFNDKKIWHENNDGPMSGLNADMLDGLHASEFKDRNGHHHFGHAFLPGGAKKFVKIASFTPRRVGVPQDFNTNGTNPFQGKFAENIAKRMEARAKFNAFVEDTPERLGPIGVNGFEHTDMFTEGVYNATLRASVSILRKGDSSGPPWNGSETVDIHVGIFEDPTNEDTNGWTCTSKYFYVSSHERNLPFIKDPDHPSHDYLTGGNVSPQNKSGEKIVRKEPNINMGLRASVTPPNESHEHSRPEVDYSDYATPPDPSKDDYISQKFPPIIPPGFSYQQPLEAFRLHYIDSDIETIDGIQVVTHKFDLYMAVDTKTEVHVQPYMSSSCLFYNYQKPISESELPPGQFLRPSSVYDNRYSHVEHRHANYEKKIEDMDSEIEEIWSIFDDYVVVDQGTANANKVIMTNATGKVVAVKDNMERHQDDRRTGTRVLVTDKDRCISESDITTKELAQLDNVRANIQDQLDELGDELGGLDIPDGDLFVKKSGDTMTGRLKMKNRSEIEIYGPEGDNSNKTRMHVHTNNGYSGLHDAYENTPICGLLNNTTVKDERIFFIQKRSFRVGGGAGAKVTVSSSAPSTPQLGDVWIKNT